MRFLKAWSLPAAIILGIGSYLFYHSIPALHCAGNAFYVISTKAQTALIFAMLFLNFCKVEPSQLQPHKWQIWPLLMQCAVFVLTALLLIWASRCDGVAARWITEHNLFFMALMLCFITPTATACAVVTGKLGGNVAHVVTYTIIINVLTSILVPVILPLVYPIGDLGFKAAMLMILRKVFPLLIFPLLLAFLVRYALPRFHGWVLKYPDLSFYLWCIVLTLAMALATRSLVHYKGSSWILLEMALSSLIACAFQFWFGRKVGSHYDCKVAAGQSMGQKNTSLMMWMALTFVDPVVSVAGGFYSIWHNCYNTWQLRRFERKK